MQGVFQHVIVVHLVLGELALNDMIRLISQKIQEKWCKNCLHALVTLFIEYWNSPFSLSLFLLNGRGQ